MSKRTALRQMASPARPGVRRPIDALHLSKQSLGDAALELEILRMFDEIVADHFAKMEAAASVAEMVHHLHTVKAASAGVGAWALAEHAYILEAEVKAGEPVNAERIEDIRMSLQEVRAFIAEQIAEDEARQQVVLH